MQLITDFANTRVVIIDNYDSFTYNLVHLVEKIIPANVTVLLNDKFELEQLQAFNKIILSPGPGLPQGAGKTMEVIKHYQSTKSILGVCLGHQAIGLAFGAKLKNLETVYHGIENNIHITADEGTNSSSLFANISMPMLVGRYHSWVIDNIDLPEDLMVTATDDNGEIMAVKHKTLDVQGIQFHPESIMTLKGEELMRNWLSYLKLT
jgi:anthranilate synthase component 2